MTGLLLALTLMSPNPLVVPTTMSTTTTLTEVSPLLAANSLLALMPVQPAVSSTSAQILPAPKSVAAPAVPSTSALTVPAPKSMAISVVNTITFATLPAPWGCIAHYESTDNLTAVNPYSGTEGAFQFDPATWTEFAPAGFPSSPLNANLGQQLTVAEIILSHRGWGQWQTAPLCGQ